MFYPFGIRLRLCLLTAIPSALLFAFSAHAQRLTLPSTAGAPATQPTSENRAYSPDSLSTDQAEILKTYPDGTKRIVPISALNFRDDGAAFGGPPQLSVYSNPSNDKKSSPERLSVAPIGIDGSPSSVPATIPPSPNPLAATPSAAGDPMGGTAPSDPMGGSVSSSADPMGGSGPVDPLSGAPAQGSPPPLQTVSGRAAPVSSIANSIDLGTYDDFFMNAAIGGSIQGQLTARRVYNGTNMQAYPYKYPTGALSTSNKTVSSENFTFQPGFRFDTEFGYNIYDWLGVSLQTGIIYNAINQYNVSFTDGTSFHNSCNGELVQVPIQLDGILRWPGATAFKPFIGGGIGAIWQQLDVNNYYLATQDVQGNYCRSAFQFGFNGQLGANYTVAPGVDFYGVFKLLGAFTPRIGNYDFATSYNFALEVGIQSRF
jgi:opacity protein-like surface antigen